MNAAMSVKAEDPYSVAALRQRFHTRLPFLEAGFDGDHLLNPRLENWVSTQAKTDAAVLIPIFDRPEGARMLLTLRVEGLSTHSGQVAFPGGKVDASDPDHETAALRESEEEVGLDRSEVEIIGRLPVYHTGSGFRISPVLAVVRPHATLEINPAEVAAIFEVPLEFLMNPANHQLQSREFRGEERFFYTMPYDDGVHGERYIWGVTAGIIRLMYERLYV